jgi:hypothetical protein
MTLKINRNTKIINVVQTKPVQKAIENLYRDIRMACWTTKKEGLAIKLVNFPMPKEQFVIGIYNGDLEIHASDDLGFVYGIYEISKTILGILPFWFWNDQKPIQQEEYIISDDYVYRSKPAAVKYRGWFVNDEVLIDKWSIDQKKEKPWEMVFEALLRCRGNLVIPGTDKNSVLYRSTAIDMGLYITHHHAEPLGAPMFARVYPALTPSYEEYPGKFQQLWKEGIQAQKNMNVIWNLGFRGQGDCPFWETDPQYRTPAARGELISKLIKLQYEFVKKVLPEAVCCTNLYGESMELYREGYLKLSEDIIRIWADNGYGKMVTRRQGNHNPRISALPNDKDHGCHGIYYHASFYDLQAAGHITMLPNSAEFVRNELRKVLTHGMQDYWLINCSNVKPHVYILDLIANLWQVGDADVQDHLIGYVESYYGQDHAASIVECFQSYSKYAIQYGLHEDEHAGEQFSNHVARILIHQYLKNNAERANDLVWATDGKTLSEQIIWYQRLCCKAEKGYAEFIRQCEHTDSMLEDSSRKLFQDSLYLQVKIHFFCYKGALAVCNSLLAALHEDYQKAFYCAGKARKAYLQANLAMRGREHGKWHNFYANECLTDVKQSAWVLEYLMGYVRNLGDGPHFFTWQRDFFYSEEDRRVLLIYNMENHLTDQELFALMEEKWGD